MKRLVAWAAICAAASLAGCAKNPESIAPMTMPVNAYSGLDCKQLGSEHQKVAEQLQRVEAVQRQAATADTVGVLLIGVPIGSASGDDSEGAVAQHKGEIIAIEAAQRNRHCGGAS